MVGTKMRLRTTLVSGLVGGLMLLSITPKNLADDRDSCYRNVQNWEQKLDRDIDRHGVNSRQANHDRHELGEARENCKRRFGNEWRDHYNRDRDGGNDHDRDYDRDRR
jgi:hypothetical protein